MTENKRVDFTSIVVRSSEVLATEIGTQTAIMSIELGTFSELSAIGSEIWGLLEKPRRVSEICDFLLDRYEVDRRQCEEDVLVYLNDLAAYNAIEVVNSAG
jgi:hypothetical protein